MSALTTNFVPLAAFGASLLGSAHCAGMCGGLALSRSTNLRDGVGYHAGRLVGYLSLGVGAGFVGEKVFSPAFAVWASWVASISMATLFFFLAYRAWAGQAPHFRWLPPAAYSRLFQGRGSFLTGIFTAALPCGWLQSFVVSAVATRSPFAGALFLFAFWFGTLPALVVLPTVAIRFLRPISLRSPRIVAVILVAAGLGSLGIRMSHSSLSTGKSVEDSGHSCGSQ